MCIYLFQSLRSKGSKHGDQALILLNWLFKDEHLFQVLAMNLSNIIMRKDDRYISLGWCILVRSLLENGSTMDQHFLNGKIYGYCILFWHELSFSQVLL